MPALFPSACCSAAEKWGFVFVLLAVFSCCKQSPEQNRNGSDPNASVFSVRLKNLKGQTVDLNACKQARAAVFYFLDPECPLCQGYALKIKNLKEKYQSQGFVFYTVWPGKLYTDTEIGQFLTSYKVDLPELLDPDFLLTNRFEASVTPEVFVTDKRGGMLYSGRIDDWAWDTGQKKLKIEHNDLEDALAGIAGNDFSFQKKTKAIGCLIEK